MARSYSQPPVLVISSVRSSRPVVSASSSSARLRAVMSEFSAMIAIGRPSSSRASAWRLETMISVPSLRLWRNSPSHSPSRASA